MIDLETLSYLLGLGCLYFVTAPWNAVADAGTDTERTPVAPYPI